MTEEAVNDKEPPIYHYSVSEAPPEEAGNTDNDETPSSGSRAAVAGAD